MPSFSRTALYRSGLMFFGTSEAGAVLRPYQQPLGGRMIFLMRFKMLGELK